MKILANVLFTIAALAYFFGLLYGATTRGEHEANVACCMIASGFVLLIIAEVCARISRRAAVPKSDPLARVSRWGF